MTYSLTPSSNHYSELSKYIPPKLIRYYSSNFMYEITPCINRAPGLSRLHFAEVMEFCGFFLTGQFSDELRFWEILALHTRSNVDDDPSLQ